MDSYAGLLRFSLLSGLIGFGVYCGIHSFQVWRKRHRAIANAHDPRSVRQAASVWAVRILGVGVLTMTLAVALREVTPIHGVLRGEGLVAVRVPDDAEVAFLCDAGAVDAETVVARFQSPRLQAEAEEAKSQAERIKVEREILQAQPLAFDPELVRRHQNAATDNRQLTQALYQLLPTETNIVREALMHNLGKQDQIARLNTDLSTSQREVEQAKVRRQHMQNLLTRDQTLTQQRAIAQGDLLDRQRDLKINELEEIKAQTRLNDLGRERQRYEEDMARLAKLADEQGKVLQAEVEQTRREMRETRAAREVYTAQLAADEARARKLRAEEIRQLDARVAEAAARLTGAQRRLLITAPFAGNVIFRAPSPRSARRQDLLLVLSPEAGFRLELRLPTQQAAALESAGPILLQADEARLEPRFSGQYWSARSLTHEPGMSVVELACQPSAETAQAMVDGAKVTTKLLWRPPFYTLPIFQLGALLTLAGAALWGGTRLRAKDQAAPAAAPAADRASASPSVASNGHAMLPATPLLPDQTAVEFGRFGQMLDVLGNRLREGILTGVIDDHLLGALEWALDRHQARAVRLLSEGLNCNPELLLHARQLARRLDAETAGSSSPAGARLLAVLRVLAPADATAARDTVVDLPRCKACSR